MQNDYYYVPQLQVNDEEKRAVLGDILYEIRFPTMTLEEFGENVASCEILTDKEARYLFTLHSGAKPAKVLPFKGKKRTPEFQLLEFPIKSVSALDVESYYDDYEEFDDDYDYDYKTVCTLSFTEYANCDIEIFEVRFCQPVGHERIDGCSINGFVNGRATNGIVAESVVKVQNETFKGFPIYAASFERAFRFSPKKSNSNVYDRRGNAAVNVSFMSKTEQHGQYGYGPRKTAVLTAHTIKQSFAVNGKPLKFSLLGYNNHNAWCCLIALKMRYVKEDA